MNVEHPTSNIQRRRLAAVAALCTVLYAGSAIGAPRDEQLATVKIECQFADGGLTFGSGVCVGTNENELLILSCAHGVHPDRSPTIMICPPDADAIRGELLAIDHDRDIAIFKCQRSVDLPAFALGKNAPPGTYVESFGYPGVTMKQAHHQRRLEGHVQPTVMDGGLTSTFSMYAEPGDSGGPIFHGGQLVGLLNLEARDKSHSAGPNADSIRQFYDERCVRFLPRYGCKPGGT